MVKEAVCGIGSVEGEEEPNKYENTIESSPKSNGVKAIKKKKGKAKEKGWVKEDIVHHVEKDGEKTDVEEGRKKRKKLMLEVTVEASEAGEGNREISSEVAEDLEKVNETEFAEKTLEDHIANGSDLAKDKKRKKREKLLREAKKAKMRGVCYLSRVPPHMDPATLRHMLSQYGEIQRIYLAPENPAAHPNRRKTGGYRGKGFSEGWVEFTDKRVAKQVANMLNGEQIGGRKRSQFYFDLWNIKYLSKFKWDDLKQENAYKGIVRQQRLSLEISAAKRERDLYLSKVDKSRALSFIEERLKKKQKIQEDTEEQLSVGEQVPRVIRQFQQKKAVADMEDKTNSRISKDILVGVFGKR